MIIDHSFIALVVSERKEKITSSSGDNSKYLYAALPQPLPSTAKTSETSSKVVIHGMEQSVVSIEFGAPSGGFNRNNSVFEDQVPEGADSSAGCYVNCELSNQVAGTRVSILEEDLQCGGGGGGKGKMSKASAKAAKVNIAL